MHIKNILIADDHDITMRGISDILREKFTVDEILMFTNPVEVVDAVEKQHYDLYILDLEFEDSSGLELIKKIRALQPNAKVIVCTMHEEIWNINALLTLCVDGIILKRTLGDFLEQAVVAVMQHESYMCPRFTLLKSKVPAYKRQLKTKNSQPTKQELVVLQHIAQGHTSREIGDMLSISENAIEGYRKNLFDKLQARNVAHLVAIAIRQRLIELD